jgi:Phytanoyl-CoA dioxygenase (PhyH)
MAVPTAILTAEMPALDKLRASYHEFGYVVVPAPSFSQTALDILQLASDHLDLTNCDGIRLSSLDPRLTVIDTIPFVVQLPEHPDVLEVVQELLETNDFRIYHVGFNNRTPGVSELVNWHTDFPEEDRDRARRIEVGWYLTETCPSNGALRVLPGSHRRSRKVVEVEFRRIAAKDKLLWRSQDVHHPDELALELGPGSLLLRHPFLWHCTFQNCSGSTRYLYTWSYCGSSETTMLIDYELILPREVVEFPTELQKRLYLLGDADRQRLRDRNGLAVRRIRERLVLLSQFTAVDSSSAAARG